MKTAEEWIRTGPSLYPTSGEFVYAIQLDAMKEGMRRAAEIADSLAKHNVGQDWQKERRNIELYNMGIGQEQAWKAILTAAEQLSEKDL